MDKMDESALSASRPESPNEVECEQVNWLLRVTGIFAKTHVEPVRSLTECTPSFFVVLFEHMFQVELPMKMTDMGSRETQLHNVRMVVENLAAMIQRPLRHIDPERVCDLDEQHVRRLLRVCLFIVVRYQIGIWNPGSLLEAIESDFDDDAGSEVPSQQQAAAPPTYHPSSHHHHGGTSAAPPDGVGAAADDRFGPSAALGYQGVAGGTKRVSRVATWQSSVEPPVPPHFAAAAARRQRQEEKEQLLEEMNRVARRYDVPRAATTAAEDTSTVPQRAGTLGGQSAGSSWEPSPGAGVFASAAANRSSDYTASAKPLKAAPGLRSLRSGLRDEKIERLRTQKFLDESDRVAAQIAARRASEREVELRRQARRELRDTMKNALDLKKQMRDEDEVYRRVYADLMHSEAAMPGARHLTVLSGARNSAAKRAALSEVQALRSAREEIAATRKSQNEALQQDADRYQATLTAWRRPSFSRLSRTPLLV